MTPKSAPGSEERDREHSRLVTYQAGYSQRTVQCFVEELLLRRLHAHFRCDSLQRVHALRFVQLLDPEVVHRVEQDDPHHMVRRIARA